jgi:uncharacterized protein (DUF934 family)
MSVIVNRDGNFAHAAPEFDFAPLGTEGAVAFDVPSDTAPEALDEVLTHASALRIAFPSSHDGRGFSLARYARQSGFCGHLRASGKLLADQFPLALRSGFDDAEITDDRALRMQQVQWVDAASRAHTSYQSRLMRAV